MVNNPFLAAVLGNFNSQSEGSKTERTTSQFGLKQITKELIHIIGDSSSFIYLIFTTQPNLVIESAVHSSFHSNCHHHITFGKFNLKMHYPPPYEQEVWHYQKANVDQIIQAISELPWDSRFANISVNEQVQLFTQTI